MRSPAGRDEMTLDQKQSKFNIRKGTTHHNSLYLAKEMNPRMRTHSPVETWWIWVCVVTRYGW